MPAYDANSYINVAKVLEHRAESMGCLAFSYRNQAFSTDIALDSMGPIAWALVLQASSIAALTGIAKPNEPAFLPLVVATNSEAPFGNEVLVQNGKLAMSLATNLLDASLEHAVTLGIRSLGYTSAEWADLPENQRVVPLEPYFQDLQATWVTDELESGQLKQQLDNWPTLEVISNLDTPADALSQTSEAGVGRSKYLQMGRG